MNKSLFTIVVIAGLVGALPTVRASQVIGSCDEAGYAAQIEFTVSDSGKTLEIRRSYGANIAFEIGSIALKPQFIRENTPDTLNIKGNGEHLAISLKTGTGRYKSVNWKMACQPGESEWCTIRLPYRESQKLKLENCKLDLPLRLP